MNTLSCNKLKEIGGGIVSHEPTIEQIGWNECKIWTHSFKEHTPVISGCFPDPNDDICLPV